MHGFKGERVLMRIHIGEADHYQGRPMHQEIVARLRERHYAGVTVQRGIMGFGAHAHVHREHIVELSTDLPIVIECIETEERIEAFLPELEAMLTRGLVTLERAQVIMYRADLPPARRTGSWPIMVK